MTDSAKTRRTPVGDDDSERIVIQISEPVTSAPAASRAQPPPQVIVVNNTIPHQHANHRAHAPPTHNHATLSSSSSSNVQQKRGPPVTNATLHGKKNVPQIHKSHKDVDENDSSDSSDAASSSDDDDDDEEDEDEDEESEGDEEDEDARSDVDESGDRRHHPHHHRHHAAAAAAHANRHQVGNNGHTSSTESSTKRQSRMRRVVGWFRRRTNNNKNKKNQSANRRRGDDPEPAPVLPTAATNALLPPMQTIALYTPAAVASPSPYPMLIGSPSPSPSPSSAVATGFSDEPFVFEIEKWCGLMWYDIAHIPSFGEGLPWPARSHTTDYTAMYSMIPHNHQAHENYAHRPQKFRVHNTSMRRGRTSEISGVATIDPHYVPTRLGDPLVKADIHFPPLFAAIFASAIQVKGDFWIYHIQEGIYQQDSYRWAIVSERGKRHCWLIARTPVLGADDLARARSIISAMGIKPDRLVMTRHTEEDGDMAVSDDDNTGHGKKQNGHANVPTNSNHANAAHSNRNHK